MTKTYSFKCFHMDEESWENETVCETILNSFGSQGFQVVSITEHKNVRMGHLPDGVHIVMEKEI